VMTVYPWTGQAWGAACRLSLTFRPVFTLRRSYCGDRDVCRRGAKVATRIAAAYARQEVRRGHPPFVFGPPAPKAAQEAALRARLALKTGARQIAFPAFQPGDPGDGPFHIYDDQDLFPRVIAGRLYVGAIGHGGIGWRTNGPTLLAIFAEADGALTPLAGYSISLSNGGLAKARAEPVPKG
jgi:hypothetical protein